MQPELVVLAVVIGYIIGSFPTAYIIARLKGVDIFTVGSGNMGANNVARACGPQYGALVWLVDGLKGVLAIVIARLLLPDHQSVASVLGAISAVAGGDSGSCRSVVRAFGRRVHRAGVSTWQVHRV